MKEEMKGAILQQQEAYIAQKSAAAAEAAGCQEQASTFQIEATYHSAAALAQLQPAALPPVVAGEAVPDEAQLASNGGGWSVRDTLATPDTPALAASFVRTELLAQRRLDILALGIDAAAATACSDPLTKMLVHQAGLAHAAAFKLVDRAIDQDSPAETARLMNSAARMMGTFQQAMVTLHRLRNGGQQTVTVQHINVSANQTLVTGSMATGAELSHGGIGER
ncbi:hypothetical protein FBX97_5602 [Herbaspirillum sp. SJZ107]|nr:hypothetical protein FBX97_5602 [Herbaspirillum sp. SJZ107]